MPRFRISSRFRVRTVVALATAWSVALPVGAADGLPCWRPPVEAKVSDPFRAPWCRWCPGNRGLEYDTSAGVPVRAVSTGRVTFAGSVVGITYVVVRHGDDLRVTYGNLASTSFARGDLVVRGQLVGRTAGRFHLGVRDGDRYVDPAPFLGSLVRLPRLIPIDGRAPNSAPPPRLRC